MYIHSFEVIKLFIIFKNINKTINYSIETQFTLYPIHQQHAR